MVPFTVWCWRSELLPPFALQQQHLLRHFKWNGAHTPVSPQFAHPREPSDRHHMYIRDLYLS